MKFSVKSDYAARAVLSLARSYPARRACKVEELAAEHGIPANYLLQILIQLKAKHLVQSQRGKVGGYLLAKPPGEISLGDVVRALHGPVFDSPATTDPRCPLELRAAWQGLGRQMQQAADAITFQDLLEQSGKAKMYEI